MAANTISTLNPQRIAVARVALPNPDLPTWDDEPMEPITQAMFAIDLDTEDWLNGKGEFSK